MHHYPLPYPNIQNPRKAAGPVSRTPTKSVGKKVVAQKSAAKKTAPKTAPGKKAGSKIAAPKSAVKPRPRKSASAEAVANSFAKDPFAIPEAVEKLHKIILASLDDDKAEEILSIPLAGKTALADYMVIASGRSTRQVSAMAEHLLSKCRGAGRQLRVEGMATGDWVLVDTGDVIVHLFRPEVRSFYNLEKMWSVDQSAIDMSE
jgi:ribosome-associated protein